MKGDCEIRLQEAKEKIKEILESYNLDIYPNEWEEVVLCCHDNNDYKVML
jgi:spore cortex formation protein SpoVR/YcgB (stage V sporulation)